MDEPAAGPSKPHRTFLGWAQRRAYPPGWATLVAGLESGAAIQRKRHYVSEAENAFSKERDAWRDRPVPWDHPDRWSEPNRLRAERRWKQGLCSQFAKSDCFV